MGSCQYNKLIRDKIPEIIEKSGKKAAWETLDLKLYKQYLDKKLEEELQEYLECNNEEELADLVEVIYAILKYKQIDLQEFEQIRKNKEKERGGFDRRILLKEVIED